MINMLNFEELSIHEMESINGGCGGLMYELGKKVGKYIKKVEENTGREVKPLEPGDTVVGRTPWP